MRTACLTFLISLLFVQIYSQSCAGGRFADTIFTQIQTHPDILYSKAWDCDTVLRDLHFDLYEPSGDTMQERPVIIFVHGGSFVTGSKNDADIVLLSQMAAKTGFVGISCNYRLETLVHLANTIQDIEKSFQEAFFRATQDMRELIKFLRNSYNNGNPYKINPNQIIVTGISAGAIMAVHSAYMDGINEYPYKVDMPYLGSFDTTGNYDLIRGEPDAIVSIAGGIGDTSWIVPGDKLPGLYIHGTIDSIVPYNSDTARLGGFPITYIHGSQSVYFRAQHTQTPAQLKLFSGVDHYGLGSSPYKDTIVTMLKQYYEDLICTVFLEIPEVHNEFGLEIYPNPAGEYIQVKSGEAGNFGIYNIYGQEILRGNLTEEIMAISLSGLPGGVYYLRTANKSAAFLKN